MFIEPNSHIKIYRNIESSGKRRPIFKTAAAQSAYFASHLAFDYTPTTHVKYTMNKVRVGLTVAQLLGCNYLSFVNPSFGNKVYYAQIVGDPVYINNECTELTYAVDYCQTDMFNVTIESCYIDREHLSDEDFAKSRTNPFDPDIMEFWTSEPLPVDKDIEMDYDIATDHPEAFMAARKKWHGVTDYDKMVTVIAYAPIEPPNAEGLSWYTSFLDDCGNSGGQAFGFSFYRLAQEITDSGTTYTPGYVQSSAKLNSALGYTPAPGAGGLKLQTSFDQPYNIVAFESENAYNAQGDFLNHLTIWGVDDKIIAINVLPAYMIFEMFQPQSMENALFSVSPASSFVEIATIHNTKLFRYPFSYIRAISPNGDVKEFQFERSTDITEHETTPLSLPKFYFDILTDYNAQPIVSLIPMNYKMKTPGNTLGFTGNYRPNIYERLDFQSIPQVPYTTDSFLAGIAAANADMLSKRTLDTKYALEYQQNQIGYAANDLMIQGYRHGLQTIKDTEGMAGDMILGVGSAASGNVVGALNHSIDAENRLLNIAERQNSLDKSIDSLNYERAKNFRQANMVAESANLSLESLESNPVYQNMQDTKPLYVADKYVPSTGTGTYFYNDASVMDFIILVVKLRLVVKQKYDQWFSNYGFSSGRFGIPRVMKYISNAETGKPHFAPSGGMNVTYIKTNGAAVKAPSKTSETFWESMLDGGVQFIKGEELT